MTDREVTLVFPDKSRITATFNEGENLLEVLRHSGVVIASDCGGAGKCGKCRVTRIRNGVSEETLACKTFPQAGDEYLVKKEDSFVSPGETGEKTCCDSYCLALDIGTTTVAVSLISQSGERAGERRFNNPQRAYGADVISRLTAASKGKGEEMRNALCNAVAGETASLIYECGISPGKITAAAVAGNTVMTHILLGLDCSGLGAYPFTPASLDSVTLPFNELFSGSEITAETYVFPCISAFAGGDILAGIYACDMDKSEKTNMLIALGTNGEIAAGSRDGIFVTSASAGPAFEGGSLSCGTGSVPGAIYSVSVYGGKASITTIGGKEPAGICGSGVVDTAASLVRAGIAGRNGLLSEEYRDKGFPLAEGIYYTQDDMRQVQSAKSAIKTAITLLLKRTGGEIDGVYLAGGFGKGINPANAARIGLVPECVLSRIVSAGNTSLRGAEKLLAENGRERVEAIKSIAVRLDLPEDDEFNKLFVENLDF